ncbi:MAG: hypothetical protein AABY74_03775, partial [Planctomycetota bacterium]
ECYKQAAPLWLKKSKQPCGPKSSLEPNGGCDIRTQSAESQRHPQVGSLQVRDVSQWLDEPRAVDPHGQGF